MREAVIKITEKCPCNCHFCKSEDFGVSKDLKINHGIEQWFKICDELIKTGIENIIISGGEPFVYIDTILPLIGYLKERNIYTVLNTSGVYFNKLNFLDRLLGSYPNLLVFSIDSSISSQHDQSRVIPGLYDTIVNSINYIQNYNEEYPVGIRFVITKNNYNQIPDLIQNFNKLNVDCIKFTTIENDTKGTYRLSLSDLINFNSEIRPRIIETLNNANFLSEELKSDAINKFENIYNPNFIDLDLFSKGIYSPNFTNNFKCDVINRFCTVQNNGDVLPCCEAEHHYYPIYGNLLNSKSEEVFSSKEFTDFKDNRVPYCTNCTQPHAIQVNFTDKALQVNKR